MISLGRILKACVPRETKVFCKGIGIVYGFLCDIHCGPKTIFPRED